jgi:predicted ATPase
VTRLTLNRLGRGSTQAIVAWLNGSGRLPPSVLGEITARTDGVPLFIEELTKAVLEAVGLSQSVTSDELHRRNA